MRVIKFISLAALAVVILGVAAQEVCAASKTTPSPITIKAPKSNQRYSSGKKVKFSVKISIAGFSKLTFKVDSVTVGSVRKAPYQLVWKHPTAGQHKLLVIGKKGKKNYRSKQVTFRYGSGSGGNYGPPTIPVTGHPRLWFTSNDLPGLRLWAVDSNPVYVQLKAIAASMMTKYQNGVIPGTCVDANHDGTPDNAWDSGQNVLSDEFAEQLITVFGFLANIDPDSTKRQQYASITHDLIMAIINQASLGTYDEKTECTDLSLSVDSCTCRTKRRWRDKLPYNSIYVGHFLLGDRGFIFDGLPLGIDWVYSTFSANEKAKIRTAFLIWIKDFLEAEFGYAPRPIDTINSTSLLHLDNPYLSELRYGMNNHYLSYLRGVGLMSLTLDPDDDQGAPDALGHGVRDYLNNAIGSWLKVTDYARRYDAPGGLSPEGAMYSDLGFKFEMQFRLALATSGVADPNVFGEQVSFYNHPFWDNALTAHLSNMPSTPVVIQNWQGPVYQQAFYGDGQNAYQVDVTGAFASIALYDKLSGNTERMNSIKWALLNTSPGGKDKFTSRIRSTESNISVRDAVLDFLLYDPNAADPSDPRPAMDLEYYNSGLGRIMARTGWDSNSRFFTYKLGWNRIDHNHGDGNMIELWRKGQWLTKKWVAYGPRSSLSDFNNTLAVRNYCDSGDGSFHSGGYNYDDWNEGSQLRLGASSEAAYQAHSTANWKSSPMDPRVLARSMAPGSGYVYATGDSTILYNHYNQYTASENCDDVQHVSRSVVWLKPDHILVYDRALTGHNNFKRFWLNLHTQPVISQVGSVMRAVDTTLDSTQQIVIQNVLPGAASVSMTSTNARPLTYGNDESANGEFLTYRLKVEASGDPKSVRFLHVIQGQDSGATPDAASAISTVSGTAFDGAAVNNVAIMFLRDIGSTVTTFAYDVPVGTQANLITGLTPGGSYGYSKSGNRVTITPGGDRTADEGGVLQVGTLP